MFESLKYQSLRFAVQRKIFCGCGVVLDVARAVEVTYTSEGRVCAVAVCCVDCYRRSGGVSEIRKRMDAKFEVEVLDGREANWEVLDMMGDA